MTERSRAQSLLLLAAAFLIVFLLNLDCLAVKSEDWTMLPNIRAMVGRGWPGLAQLLTRPRIEFTPHLAEGLLMAVFGLAPAPLFLFLMGAHGLSCALVHAILRKLTQDEDLSVAAALACLFVPTGAGVVFYLTHSIFVLPVTLFLLTAYLYLHPRTNAWADLAALSVTALAGQLSGEQGIPLFYAAFLAAGWQTLRERPPRLASFLRAAVPCAVSLACMGALFVTVTLPYMSAAAGKPSADPVFLRTLSQLAMFHLQAFDPTSWIFGRFAQPVSPRTWAGGALLAGLLWAYFLRRRAAPPPKAARGVAPAAAILALAWLVPILLSALTGYRQGAMPKYTYGSGLCLAVLLVLTLDAAARRLARDPGRARRAAFAGLALYLGFLTHYAVREAWGAQKRLDERIWHEIDRNIAARPRFILLDGMQFGSSLVPNYRSVAYSDFAADGNDVPQRLKETAGYAPAVVTRWGRALERPDGSRGVELVSPDGRSHYGDARDILAVVLRHDWSFRDLAAAQPAVFRDAADYRRFRGGEAREFPLDRRAYPEETW